MVISDIEEASVHLDTSPTTNTLTQRLDHDSAELSQEAIHAPESDFAEIMDMQSHRGCLDVRTDPSHWLETANTHPLGRSPRRERMCLKIHPLQQQTAAINESFDV